MDLKNIMQPLSFTRAFEDISKMVPSARARESYVFCRAKEKPILCHFCPKGGFAGEHVFCLQSVWDLRISVQIWYLHICISNLKHILGSQTDCQQGILSCENSLGAEVAHNGFFLCMAEFVKPNTLQPESLLNLDSLSYSSCFVKTDQEFGSNSWAS